MSTLNTLPLNAKVILAIAICTMSNLVLGALFYTMVQQNTGMALEQFHLAMDHVETMQSAVNPSTIQELTARFEDAAKAMQQRSGLMVVILVVMTLVLNMVVALYVARSVQQDAVRGTDLRIEDMSDPELGQVLERISRALRSRGGSLRGF